MIAARLDDARARFTAIGPGHRGDSTASQSPGARPGSHSGHPDACHRGNGTGRDGRRGRPPRGGGRAGGAAQGRQGPGDRGKELPVVVPPMPPGPAKSRTNSLWTCLTVSRFRMVAG